MRDMSLMIEDDWIRLISDNAAWERRKARRREWSGVPVHALALFE